MGDKSAIEWTDATWNPVTGCDRVSPGCDHCYALTLAGRLKAMGNVRYQRDGNPRTSGPGFGLTLHEDVLDLPLRWKRPRRIFVNSMSDLFHDDVPDEFIGYVFAVMALAQQHIFQVLTKRPGRMASLVPRLVDHVVAALRGPLADRRAPVRYVDSERVVTSGPAAIAEGLKGGWRSWPSENVWLGTSVEEQRWADIRIPKLLDTPAAVRFLSCEPLLGPIELAEYMPDFDDVHPDHPSEFRVPGIDWVIVGGESGPGARPMQPDWARSLRDQCAEAGVPFFFKQWGEWAPVLERDWPLYPGLQGRGYVRLDDVPFLRVGKRSAGHVLDGRTWEEVPA